MKITESNKLKRIEALGYKLREYNINIYGYYTWLKFINDKMPNKPTIEIVKEYICYNIVSYAYTEDGNKEFYPIESELCAILLKLIKDIKNLILRDEDPKEIEFPKKLGHYGCKYNILQIKNRCDDGLSFRGVIDTKETFKVSSYKGGNSMVEIKLRPDSVFDCTMNWDGSITLELLGSNIVFNNISLYFFEDAFFKLII